MLNTLPNELKICIISFLNIKEKDIINLIYINKEINRLIRRPITLYKYPELYKQSFLSFSLEYLTYEYEKKKLQEECDRKCYYIHYLDMLVENNWV
tara:strand:- start:442 stop:729 length:288 start_codon:yes stop_codon:yes gene_type:complete